MNITSEKRDLFTVQNDYYLAHCISADYALGAGIALIFNKKYNMSAKLNNLYPTDNYDKYIGKALLIDNVFNLVTKERYFYKPTYITLRMSLEDMREQCLKNGIKKLAMPLIGCGLDKLSWDIVENIIINVFKNDDINILICKL